MQPNEPEITYHKSVTDNFADTLVISAGFKKDELKMQLMLLKMQDKIKNPFLVFGSIFLSIAIVEISSFVARRIIVENLPVFLDQEKSKISHKNLDLSSQIEIINSKTYKYEKKWISFLKNISKQKINSIIKIDKDYTKLLSDYILKFINEFSIKEIDFVSSHGHTAIHQPSNSLTYQIGNLPIFAKYINQKVVCDFRVQDLELGGQGAPLVPVGEKYLFPEFDTFTL